jgi:hypothetical protein
MLIAASCECGVSRLRLGGVNPPAVVVILQLPTL